MTPRSRRYFAIKKMRHYCRDAFALVAMMIERSKPIPKYPPGTQHPGGPAIVGEGGPQIVLRAGQIAIVTIGKESAMLLPSGHVIPQTTVTASMLEKPVADLTKTVNNKVLSDIMAEATKEVYSKLPSFVTGK